MLEDSVWIRRTCSCDNEDTHISEYGPELHIRNIVETSCTKQETVDFIRELNAMISPRDIRRIAGIVGGDIFSASENLSMEEKICSKTKADFVSVSDVFKKVRRLKRELDLFKFLGEYNGTYEHCMKLMKKYPTDALEVYCINLMKLFKCKYSFYIIDRIAFDQGIDRLTEERIAAILYWCMKKESGSGNAYVTFEQLS